MHLDFLFLSFGGIIKPKLILTEHAIQYIRFNLNGNVF